MEDSLTRLFVFIDDFTKAFNSHMNVEVDSEYLVPYLNKQLGDNCRLASSEILTVIVHFHVSGFKTFKHYYKFLGKYHSKEFPKLISYNRFVEIQNNYCFELFVLSQPVLADCDGLSYIDSTHLPVCHIKREYSHETFRDLAIKSKSTMGWYFGFKFHMITNKYGHPISYEITRSTVDDRKAPDSLFTKIFGELYGDKGYIGKPFFERMSEKCIQIITALKKNMKPQIMTLESSKKLGKRSIIESVFNCLKNNLNMQHTRHRSPKNYVINLIGSITAHCFKFVSIVALSENEMLKLN